VSREIWAAMQQLWRLMKDEEKSEDKYQSYFERNPVVFTVLGYDYAKSFEKKSGNKLPFDEDENKFQEPDFICGTKKGLIPLLLQNPKVLVGYDAEVV